VEAPEAVTYDASAGQNPQYGASLHYWLKTEPKGDVTLSILDAGGAVVRTVKGAKNVGVNRVWWNLRFEPTKEVRMRTSPLYAPEMTVGPEGRRSPDVGRVSLLAPPGNYTVKLSVGGQEFSQTLEVRKDPNSGGSEAEIAEQTKLLIDLQGDLNAAVEIVNAVEAVRGQLVSLRNLIGADTAKAAVNTAADSLDQKLVAVEETLVQLRVTGRGQDQIRWPIQTGGRLVYLANEVGGSDFAPTTQQREVAQVLKGEVQAARGRFELVMKEVTAFNAMLAERNVSGVIIR
jgi:hypothetical protein